MVTSLQLMFGFLGLHEGFEKPVRPVLLNELDVNDTVMKPLKERIITVGRSHS